MTQSNTQRAATLGAVIALHILLLLVLSSTGTIPPILPALLPARLIIQSRRPPPPPPRIQPTLAAAPALAVPVPEVKLAAPPPVQPLAPRAIARAAPAARAASHFGAATDSGLGLDVAAGSGGGAGARGTLAQFEAAVRAQVLAAKHQPRQAWDRRNTCVVNYRVSVSRSGGLSGFSIDPCGVPEINEAARAAIRAAGPFPPPPDLGGGSTDVHGTLIFHP